MLDDLGVLDGAPRRLLDEHLFRAAFYIFAHLHADERVLDGWFLRQTSAELVKVVPNHSDFWARYRRSWEGYEEATLAIEDPTFGSTEAELWSVHTTRTAPSALGPLAVAAVNGQQDLDQIEILLDHLGFVGMVRVELAGMMRHLAHGFISPTVRWMVAQLGMDLTEPPGAEVVVGEIVLGGAMEPMIELCTSHLQEAAKLASELQLPTFGMYAQHLAATLDKSGIRTRPKGAAVGTGPSTLQTPTQMAAGFLLADPTLREAWEVHRWGLLGAVEMSAQFPAGLILEILAVHGLEMTELIDGFFGSIEGKRLAYYDHPVARPYVESDTLGLLLRLYRHSGQGERNGKILGEYLELLHKRVRPDGRLPVWLVEGDQAPAMVLGEGCGTIEANLLVGLLDYQPHEHMSLIMPAAHRLLDDYVTRGASINVNYPHHYARAVVAELIDRLEILDSEITELAPARQRLRAEISRAAQHARITPQEAACLVWSCSRPGLADLIQDSWNTTITRTQSFDGGWAGEPFFFAPAPGGRTMWYSSRLLTTALCFHALSMPTPGG